MADFFTFTSELMKLPWYVWAIILGLYAMVCYFRQKQALEKQNPPSPIPKENYNKAVQEVLSRRIPYHAPRKKK